MYKTIHCVVILLMLSACATTAPKSEVEQDVVFYPPPPERPRIQFLYSITTEEDFGEKQSALDRYLLGNRADEKTIKKPYDVASSKGKIYVMDRIFKKILVLDLVEKEMGFVHDTGIGALSEPSGIWVTPDDIKYVADMKRRQVVAFDAANRYLRTYGSKEIFDKPVDVAVFENRIYVCDMAKNKIFILDRETGSVQSNFGNTGTEEGELYKPTHVVVDHEGHVLVNDAFNFRVQKFDAHGSFIKSFGYLGDTLGAFARPKGIDVDREGHLYVADAAFENVQIFDGQTGRLLLFFGGPGTRPGDLYLPSAVSIDYQNVPYFANFADKLFRVKYLLYVSSMFGGRKLNIYGYGDWLGE